MRPLRRASPSSEFSANEENTPRHEAARSFPPARRRTGGALDPRSDRLGTEHPNPRADQMNPFALVIPGLVGMEVILVVLRLRKIIVCRWWMMTPLWLGSLIFIVEATAAATAVMVARDLLRWVLP